MIIDFQFPVTPDNNNNGPPTAGTSPNITIPTTLPYSEGVPRSLRGGYVGDGGPAALTLWALVEEPTFPKNTLSFEPIPQWVNIESDPTDGSAIAGTFNVTFASIRDGRFYLQWNVALAAGESGTVLATALLL